MLDAISLDRALCLPVTDVAALLNGQSIAVIPQVSIQKGWTFALYPTQANSHLPIERQYHPQILPLLKSAISQSQTEIVNIEVWAKCEHCKLIHEVEQLEILSHLTIWKKDALKEAMEQKQHLFLALLRIYRLPEKIQVISPISSSEKLGKFVSFSALSDRLDKTVKVREIIPVLSDVVFDRHKRQLEELRPPLHPELEKLQFSLHEIAELNPEAERLNDAIRTFLGWSNQKSCLTTNPDLNWIQKIDALGRRTLEEDDGRRKSNWQAGTDFENIVHKSLRYLGFTVDETYHGGSGGLDFYCSDPYPLVGECKAGRKIPSGTTRELIGLSGKHLDPSKFLMLAKFIIGPGILTPDEAKEAEKWRVSVIRPMTLQKLVELQTKYRNSINLIELKEYLLPGQIDYKIEEYIEKVEQQIQLRSHVVKALKNYLHVKNAEDVGIERFCGFYDASNPPRDLSERELHELLIELSSPLTGYLGRRKGSDGIDRFYFLRDLNVE
jgi:hypothetical protein